MTTRLNQSKALANDVRLTILNVLADPDAHFAHQETGKPSDIGVCVTLMTERLGISQPTVSRHLDLLHRAGFVRITKQGRWSFFQRDEAAINDYKDWMNDHL